MGFMEDSLRLLTQQTVLCVRNLKWFNTYMEWSSQVFIIFYDVQWNIAFSENPPDPNKLKPEPSVREDDAIVGCVSGVPALDPGKEPMLVTKVKTTRPEKKKRKEFVPEGKFVLSIMISII